MAHFTLAEFVASQTAEHGNINNALPASLEPAAEQTLLMMERIRAYLCDTCGHDVPIRITSGYRCPMLNAAVGGSRTSDHLYAQACDFVAPSFGPPFEIAEALKSQLDTLNIGQLIHEFGQWVHVSTNLASRANRVITIGKATTPGIWRV
jgi:hypothetical protein